jgi:long-chain fatty acid transport protein
MLQDRMVSATLPLVEEYTIGLTYKITPKWLVSADLTTMDGKDTAS